MEDRLLTTNEVAERLGVTANRVRAMVTAGQLPFFRLGQVYVIREADLALVANRKVGRPPKQEATAKASKRAVRSRKA
jgi:excisionase family DNA binding protein